MRTNDHQLMLWRLLFSKQVSWVVKKRARLVSRIIIGQVWWRPLKTLSIGKLVMVSITLNQTKSPTRAPRSLLLTVRTLERASYPPLVYPSLLVKSSRTTLEILSLSRKTLRRCSSWESSNANLETSTSTRRTAYTFMRKWFKLEMIVRGPSAEFKRSSMPSPIRNRKSQNTWHFKMAKRTLRMQTSKNWIFSTHRTARFWNMKRSLVSVSMRSCTTVIPCLTCPAAQVRIQ